MGASLDAASVEQFSTQAQARNLTDFLLNIIPTTVVGAFAAGSMLQVVLVSILFGIALSAMGQRAKPVVDFLEIGTRLVFGVVAIIMKLAPIGVFGAMAYTVGRYGIDSLGPLAKLMAVFSVLSLAFLFIVLGVVSYSRLAIVDYADITYPVVIVSTSLPGASPESMMRDISKPVEEALNTVQGIKEITSTSLEGNSIVRLQFNLGVDIGTALQDVQAKIARIRRQLPPAIEDPIIRHFDPNESPIMAIAIQSRERSLRELTDLADDVIQPRIEAIPGVGGANIVGGNARQIRVQLDPAAMRAYNVSPAQVAAALQRENQEVPAGRVTRGETAKYLYGLEVLVNGRPAPPATAPKPANLIDVRVIVLSLCGESPGSMLCPAPPGRWRTTVYLAAEYTGGFPLSASVVPKYYLMGPPLPPTEPVTVAGTLSPMRTPSGRSVSTVVPSTSGPWWAARPSAVPASTDSSSTCTCSPTRSSARWALSSSTSRLTWSARARTSSSSSLPS